MPTLAPAATIPTDDRVVLYNVGWQTYARLRQELSESPIRLTYDGSNLELMSPSRQHELISRYLGWMIRTIAAELDIPIGSGGSMTFQRSDLARGLEPDDCFWISNEPAVGGKLEVDLNVDPPPDLAIEIDMSPSRLQRPGIYAALQIPEIWRYDGEVLHVDVLQADGRYRASSASLAFPFLPMGELTRFLSLARGAHETQCMRAFLQWLREQDFAV